MKSKCIITILVLILGLAGCAIRKTLDLKNTCGKPPYPDYVTVNFEDKGGFVTFDCKRFFR